MRVLVLCCAVIVAAHTPRLSAQAEGGAPLSLLDVPYISQSELLCGGAAAAMVLRYWGQRGLDAESFAPLVDRSAAGIRTDTLIADLRRRGWPTSAVEGTLQILRVELTKGRPVLTLVEDRPATFHYIVVVAASEAGIVFHDPARAPFLVMSSGEFDRRWQAANRWMAIVLPADQPASSNGSSRPPEISGGRVAAPQTPACEQRVAGGVQLAQAGDLAGAERSLASAIGCSAALRELAGVRVLQKRWAEASDLAMAATAADGQDAYAWKVLATSRFVQHDRMGALAAWNETGEPRVDLVRIDGLTRTRHRVVERLMSVEAGSVLTSRDFVRATRRLAELPAARSTRLDYVPVPSGLVELRGSVVERPLLPTSPIVFAAMGIAAIATRDVRLTTGSMVGGGEQAFASWRFWPGRPRVAAGMTTPAPWGGVWNVMAFASRQPFSSPAVQTAHRTGGRMGAADWLSAGLRWSVVGGVDRWNSGPVRGTLGGAVRLLASGDRLDARIGADTWPGRAGFATTDASLTLRSSTGQQGLVLLAATTVQHASRRTPEELWWAGDTGSVRSTLLRAHPMLKRGRLRTDRLGRLLLQGSVEAQQWWHVAGPVRLAAASFLDAASTALRFEGATRHDIDLGLGVRFSAAGMPGIFRIDLGKGLRDGRTAVSFVYEP